MSELRNFLKRLIDEDEGMDDDTIIQVLLNALSSNFRNLDSDLIVDQAPAILAAVNTELRYIYVNETHAAFFGWKRHDILGRMPIDVLGEAAWHTAKRNMERILLEEESEISYGLTVTNYKGEVRELAGRYMPKRNNNGEIIGVLVLALDVTDRIELEREQHALRRTLQDTGRLEALGNLAGGIVHDVNNLMSVISINSELPDLNSISKSDISERFSSISGCVSRATDLMDQLKEFARGDGQDNIGEVDISQLTPIVLKLIRRILPPKVKINKNIKNKCYAAISPSKFEQILVNLIINSRDAMPNGGEINISVDRKTGAGKNQNEYCRIVVSDNGIGIPKDYVDNIFDPLFSTKRKQGGSGLGLASVKSIVSGAKGYITVESTPHKSTSFEVLIPSIAHAPRNKPPETLQDFKKLGGSETILICDDFGAIVNTSASILDLVGYNVIKSTDPMAAAEIISDNRDEIDLLITDMEMPNMSGKDLSEIAKSVNSKISVILSSGSSLDISDSEKNVDHFLQKPYSSKALLSLVRKAIDAKKISTARLLG